MNIAKTFIKYVSQNILGMLGVSCYILADTFFISKAAASNGITVLNLALPIYGVIFAIGALVGVGSATRYTIEKAKNNELADSYLFHSLIWLVILSIPFVLVGIFAPEGALALMGADTEIAKLGREYTSIFMSCAPFFMLNHLFVNFVRNDHDPSLAMIATVASSGFNIIFDYLFMFPCQMGLKGAALATGISPMLAIGICCIHFAKKSNQLVIKPCRLSLRRLLFCCQLGISAMIGEFSSAVTTTVFNYILLSLVGNVGVAAYGVVANCALVSMAIFNGIAQGTQPLVSKAYATKQRNDQRRILLMGIVTAFGFGLLLVTGTHFFAEQIVAIFNSEHNLQLENYAVEAMRLYFLGYLVAGFNVFVCGYFGASNRPAYAFVCSILRGAVAIVTCAFVLSMLWGVKGVWMSFLAAECITFCVSGFFLVCKSKHSVQ